VWVRQCACDNQYISRINMNPLVSEFRPWWSALRWHTYSTHLFIENCIRWFIHVQTHTTCVLVSCCAKLSPFAIKHKPNALRSWNYQTKFQILTNSWKRKKSHHREVRCFRTFCIQYPLPFSSSCYTDVYSKTRKIHACLATHESCTQETVS